MGKYLLKRFLSLIPVAFIISIILFIIVTNVPGDPVDLAYSHLYGDPMFRGAEGAIRLEEFKAQKREELGLNDGDIVRYVRWIGRSIQGDFGYSPNHDKPVSEVIKEPLKISIIVNVISLILSFTIAIIVGIKSALKRFSFYDSFWQVTSLVFMSMPTFFIGLSLIFLFPITLGWLEFGGLPPVQSGLNIFEEIWRWVRHLTLPIITLTIGSLAGTIRYVRNAMIEVLKKDYIRTARAKGLREKVVIYSHAFRNALIPVVTIVAGSLVGIFGGSAITESVFAINGIGSILIKALNDRDYNIVLTMNLFYALLALLANIIMDISYAFVDPRVKLD
ncbi:MAG: ABC transporter permease [Bacilli bacterium]